MPVTTGQIQHAVCQGEVFSPVSALGAGLVGTDLELSGRGLVAPAGGHNKLGAKHLGGEL